MLSQVRKLWNDLGLRQRVTITVSLILVVLGMCLILVWSSRPQMHLLYSRVEASDMSEIVAALEEQGLSYRIGENSTSIYVPGEQVHKARLELAAKGIPSGGTVGFEIFDRTNFGVSNFVQHTNYIRAVQGELARTITQLKAVQSARVMVVIPENKLLVTSDDSKPSASVFVESGREALDKEAVRSIRFLVANAVEGLTPANVAVVDNHGQVLSENLDDDDFMGTAVGKLKYQTSLENYYVKKIESMLSPVVGNGKVVVRVSAEIDTDSQTTVEEIYDPNVQVVRNQNITEDATTTQESHGNKVVGSSANLPDGGGDNGNKTNTTKEERKNRSISYEINRTTVETVSLPGSMKRISAAVFLALNYTIDEEGIETAAPRSKREIESIQRMVANALGVYGEVEEMSQYVSIEEVAFATTGIVEQNDIFNFQDNPYFWIRIGRNLLALLAAIVMLLVFLRMVKRQRSQMANLEVISYEQEESAAKARKVTSSGLTPDLLNSLIEEKPENVSTALKNWVTNMQQNNE